MALLIGTAALLFALRDVKISTRAAMMLGADLDCLHHHCAGGDGGQVRGRRLG